MRTSIFIAALALVCAPLGAHAQDSIANTPSNVGEMDAMSSIAPASPLDTASPLTTAPSTYQVVRLGDSQLTCPQLLTEINTLSAEASAAMNFDYSAMMPKGISGMGGAGMGGIGMLSGLDPTGISSMVAGKAMAAKAQADANKQMEEMEKQMALLQTRMSEGQQKQQRVQHLQTLFQQKQC
jgi:hypothetical protein